MKTLFFLRHGKTEYTNIFPDLTEEGKREAEQSADHILEIMEGSEDLKIISSPLPRALGTASIIANKLGYHSDIKEENAIRCMDFYDEEKAFAIWQSFPSARGVDKAYDTDKRFETGEYVEKRSDIKRRIFGYLRSVLEELILDNLSDFTIHVSHYEVLCNLVSIFELKEPLIHGEVIRIDLVRESSSGDTIVKIFFRNHCEHLFLNLPRDLLSFQSFGKNLVH